MAKSRNKAEVRVKVKFKYKYNADTRARTRKYWWCIWSPLEIAHPGDVSRRHWLPMQRGGGEPWPGNAEPQQNAEVSQVT